MLNPTTFGLLSLILVCAVCTITKSSLTALRSFFSSAISRTFTLFHICCKVLPNVAFACNLARSDSNSDRAALRCLLHKSIHCFSQGFFYKRKNSMDFCNDESVFHVQLKVSIVRHVLCLVHQLWN